MSCASFPQNAPPRCNESTYVGVASISEGVRRPQPQFQRPGAAGRRFSAPFLQLRPELRERAEFRSATNINGDSFLECVGIVRRGARHIAR